MAKTRARDLATGLGRAVENSIISADGSITISGGRTVQAYDIDSSGALLYESTSGKVSGDMAYLQNQNEMYVWNDSDTNWYQLKTDDDPLDTLAYYPTASTGGEFINNSTPRDGANAGSTWDNFSAVNTVSGFDFRISVGTAVSTTSWNGAATAEPLPTGKRYFEVQWDGIISGAANVMGFILCSWKGYAAGTNNITYYKKSNGYLVTNNSNDDNTGLGTNTTNDIYMFCYDTTQNSSYGRWWIGKNGSWADQGTPDGGLYNGIAVGGNNTSFYNEPLIFGIFTVGGSTVTNEYNFRDRHSITYAPPTGFTAI
jgi:hypothetical protein